MNRLNCYYCYGGITNKILRYEHIQPNLLTKVQLRRYDRNQDGNSLQIIFAHTSWSKNCSKCMDNLQTVLEKNDNFKKHLKKLDVEKDTQIHKIGGISCVPTLQIWSKKECKGELVNPQDANEIETFLHKHFRSESSLNQPQPTTSVGRYTQLLYEAHNKQNWDTLKSLLYDDGNQTLVSNITPENYLFELSLISKDRDFNKAKEIFSELLKYDTNKFQDEDLTHTIISRVIILLNDIPSRKNLKKETLLRQIDSFQKSIKSNTPTSINLKKHNYLGIGQLTPYDIIITQLLKHFISTQYTYSPYANFSNIEFDTEKESNNTNHQGDIHLVTKLIIARLYLCLASRSFHYENFSEAFEFAIKSYQQENELQLNENNFNTSTQATTPSMLFLQSMITILGNTHPSVAEARSQLDFITGNYKFHPNKIPFAKVFRGGRPRILRGKSGKWQWLGPEWKPPWVPKWKN